MLPDCGHHHGAQSRSPDVGRLLRLTIFGSPAAITVHGQQPVGPRSTIQTRRQSRPQSPSTAAHQDPPRATTAVLVHCPYPMPTRHRVRHQHHDQPT
ncbi:unnamed protein product [Pleuronectes platessa]|uniref:Uncharacterized protein n=1 Tax=Pleuronectes platessa TaxID=8262 RepID=A0A9N7UQP6_PLEPL|nr:unnamed protein product [Pleuronectes platessa]